MRRSEVAGDLWTIPAERTKNGLLHLVPLSAAAQAILAGAPRIAGSDFILTTNGVTAISGFATAKQRLDEAVLAIAQERAATRRQNEPVQIIPWRLHDLRRTLASGLARLGQPVHVIEAVLNHRSGAISGVAAVYNRHSYAQEKQEALEKWAQHVLKLAERANAPE
jgi:integrase